MKKNYYFLLIFLILILFFISTYLLFNRESVLKSYKSNYINSFVIAPYSNSYKSNECNFVINHLHFYTALHNSHLEFNSSKVPFKDLFQINFLKSNQNKFPLIFQIYIKNNLLPPENYKFQFQEILKPYLDSHYGCIGNLNLSFIH